MSDEQQLPPGPWKWQRVIPQGPVEWGHVPATEPGDGVALVAADGTWIVSSETGYGIPEVHPAARPLLEQAWRLADHVDQHKPEDEPPPRKSLRSSYGKLSHLAEELGDSDVKAVRADLTEQADRALDNSVDEVAELSEQLRLARHWARVAWVLADEELTGQVQEPPAWLTGLPEDDPTWWEGQRA